MKCRISLRSLGVCLCALLAAGCQSQKVGDLQPHDELIYRISPSPIELMRGVNPVGAVELDVHGNGAAHYYCVSPKGTTQCDMRLPPQQVGDLFAAVIDAGLEDSPSDTDSSKQPSDVGGQLSAGGELEVRLEGRTHRYFWTQDHFPAQAQPVRAPLQDIIKTMSSSAMAVR